MNEFDSEWYSWLKSWFHYVFVYDIDSLTHNIGKPFHWEAFIVLMSLSGDGTLFLMASAFEAASLNSVTRVFIGL